MNLLKKWSKAQVFWPIVIFLLILLINGIVSGGAFFEMKIVEGHLYGRIIDILRNGSKLMLLATGMTFVLATGGDRYFRRLCDGHQRRDRVQYCCKWR